MQADITTPRRVLGAHSEKNAKDIAATITIFLAIITTGLSAGLFYGWQVTVIPGLRLLDDAPYIETMNSVNSTIPNAGFGITFLGSVVFMLIALGLRARQWRTFSFGLLGASLTLYLLGLLFITFSIHVPMNEDLLTYTDLSKVDVAAIRSDYETRWNAWHLVRTFAAIGSFALLLGAVFSERRSLK